MRVGIYQWWFQISLNKRSDLKKSWKKWGKIAFLLSTTSSKGVGTCSKRSLDIPVQNGDKSIGDADALVMTDIINKGNVFLMGTWTVTRTVSNTVWTDERQKFGVGNVVMCYICWNALKCTFSEPSFSRLFAVFVPQPESHLIRWNLLRVYTRSIFFQQ